MHSSLLGAPVRGFTPFKKHKQGVQARVVLPRAAQPLRLAGVVANAGASGSRNLVRASAAAPAATTAAPASAAAVATTPSNGAAPARSGLVKDAPSFQEAITKLQEYWASVGCAIWLPHNTEVSNWGDRGEALGKTCVQHGNGMWVGGEHVRIRRRVLQGFRPSPRRAA